MLQPLQGFCLHLLLSNTGMAVYIKMGKSGSSNTAVNKEANAAKHDSQLSKVAYKVTG